MSLASDLMGFGLPPLLAQKLASGGVGPLTLTPAGTTYAGSTKIGCCQYVVSVSTGSNNTKSIGLPTVGGDVGALLCDDFIVNNADADSFVLRASTGVAISAGGVNDSKYVVGIHTSIALYPISTTQWIGVRGT